jgi:hypothetical protein
MKTRTSSYSAGISAEMYQVILRTTLCILIDRAAPSSRERLSLRDGYFAFVIRATTLGISPPATPKPGDLRYRPLATSRPVSVGPKGRKPPRQGAVLRPFGLSGRAVEYAVSRPIGFYRLTLPPEYIFPLQARSPRRVGPTLRTAASLAASETIGDDFFEGLEEVASTLRAASGTNFEQIVPGGHSQSQLASRQERPHALRTVSHARRLLLSALFSRSFGAKKTLSFSAGISAE